MIPGTASFMDRGASDEFKTPNALVNLSEILTTSIMVPMYDT